MPDNKPTCSILSVMGKRGKSYQKLAFLSAVSCYIAPFDSETIVLFSFVLSSMISNPVHVGIVLEKYSETRLVRTRVSTYTRL